MRALWINVIMVMVLMLPFGEALAMPVQHIQVELDSVNPLPETLRKRMEASIYTVGKKVLLQRQVEIIQHRQKEYEFITKDITSRVLYGYDVEQVKIYPGKDTKLYVKIAPFGQTIQHINVRVEYGNISPLGKSLLEKEISRLVPQIKHMLLGAPFDSLEWVTSVAESELRNRLQLVLPEFIAQVAIKQGKETDVLIYIIPQGRIIRHIQVHVDSNTLPSSMFYGLRNEYEEKISGLQGLPIAFVATHRQSIETWLKKSLGQSRAAKRFGVLFEPELIVGDLSDVYIHANTSRYVIKGEGRIDMGRKDDNVSFMAHIGYNLTAGDEVYVETLFYPGDYKWEWYPSYMHRFSKDLQGGYQYEVNRHNHWVWLCEQFAPRWYIKGRRNLTLKQNQLSLLYDVGNHLQLEYIFETHRNWLRLIGHL